MSNLLDKLIDYEQGLMNDEETVKLFSELIKSGDAWTLQGNYGRTAHALIECNFLTDTGEITEYAKEFIEDGYHYEYL